MAAIYESDVEQLAIELPEEQGYSFMLSEREYSEFCVTVNPLITDPIRHQATPQRRWQVGAVRCSSPGE